MAYSGIIEHHLDVLPRSSMVLRIAVRIQPDWEQNLLCEDCATDVSDFLDFQMTRPGAFS